VSANPALAVGWGRMLTDVAGSSVTFLGGIIFNANSVKALLIKPEDLAQLGAMRCYCGRANGSWG